MHTCLTWIRTHNFDVHTERRFKWRLKRLMDIKHNYKLFIMLYIHYVYKRHLTFSKRLGHQLISLKNLILNS